MPEVTVTYKTPQALEALKNLSKSYDLVISKPKTRKKAALPKNTSTINWVTVVPGDPSIDISELSDIFTGKNIDAKKLRKEAWQRNK